MIHETTLHVTNGDCTAVTLRETGRAAVLTWVDVLHEGPVPGTSPERLRETRARFLSECGWGDRRVILEALERRDDLVGRALQDGRPVVLWFEHDLYDQLQLIQILALAAERGHDPARLELINVGAFEGRSDFHGLGELTAGELESLWPARRPVTGDIVEVGRLAWEAFRSPAPVAIERFSTRNAVPLPFLAAALRRLLEELPSVEGGLSRSEQQLLEGLADRPQTPAQLFSEVQAREEAPFDGDTWIFRRLAGLAAGDTPLLTLATGEPLPTLPARSDEGSFAAAPLALTATGRAVLAGDADRVELAGIDRWLGGTHLRGDRVWRWDSRA